jgi:hypothetical protein
MLMMAMAEMIGKDQGLAASGCKASKRYSFSPLLLYQVLLTEKRSPFNFPSFPGFFPTHTLSNNNNQPSLSNVKIMDFPTTTSGLPVPEWVSAGSVPQFTC